MGRFDGLVQLAPSFSLLRFCGRATPLVSLNRLSLFSSPSPSWPVPSSFLLINPSIVAFSKSSSNLPNTKNKMSSDESMFSMDDESDGFVPEIVSAVLS